jgi:predicted ribosomally synthesized peptide with nif11-like leader
MSEEQLAALLAKLKDDAGLQEKLRGVADLDALLAIAKDAGFDVSKAAWLRYQASETLELSDEELEGTLELSDEELEGVAGGQQLFGCGRRSVAR